MKTVAMIPVMLASTRIPDKNLILVDGAPMIYYVVEACRDANIFDEIIINSEHYEFEYIAKLFDVGFYRRKPDLGGSKCTMKNKSQNCNGTRCTVHDHFITAFLKDIECDYLFQVHTTSPLLKGVTIRSFVNEMLEKKMDSMFAVVEDYKESLLGDHPLNFSKKIKTGTQDLKPLNIISWGISGWKKKTWLESYNSDNPEEDGPTYCGKMGLYPINKIEALDADDWDDLFIIEACLSHRKKRSDLGKFKWNNRIIKIDRDLKKLLHEDGIPNINWDGINTAVSNIENIKKKMGPPPWNYMVTYTDVDQAGIFCQEKGEGARYHCHVTKAEWWYVYEGSFDWLLDGGKKINAKAGEFVFLPKGTVHAISCTSDEPGIRIAFGGRDFEHIYVKKK